MKTYRDLTVWQKSIKLIKEVCALTSKFSKETIYSLNAQIKRAVITIPSNIIEGSAMILKREYIHFLFIAFSSFSELDAHIIIAKNMNFINGKVLNEIFGKLLNIK